MNKFRRTSFEVAANFSMTSNQKIKFTFCIFDFFCCQQLEIPNKKVSVQLAHLFMEVMAILSNINFL